jgi:hypothetical protein
LPKARPSGEVYLILFSAGGVLFATEAFSVRGVAEADWQPASDPDAGKQDLLIDMAALLGLPTQAVTRTILVDTPRGTIGFAVDQISKEEITQHAIKAVPALLLEWMSPVAVTGFFEHQNKVIGVLDFKRLAQEALLRNPVQEKPKTDPEP